MNHLNLYWGEIHNHNEIGYGLGALERSYQIARNSLDFYAFTPHGWWADPPENDQTIKKYHVEGSDRVLGQWSRVVQAAEDNYRKGEFVTFPAYEWHSSQWGDWCVYFPDGKADLYRAPDIHALKDYARQKGLLLIPHHCAYKVGWRGTNWHVRDPELSPVSEIFSEHGCSLETASPFGMTRHSMGGSCRSQTILERLRQGDVTGFTAGTDNHDGYPGSYGEGLTAIYAEKLTRESVREAFQKRHTYAVTGDRIEMQFGAPGAFMGDIVSASEKQRDFSFKVLAQDEIEYVMILKNGVPEFITVPVPTGKEPERVKFKIEWGWGAMKGLELTRWQIEVCLNRGKIKDITPCFSGGSEMTDSLNLIRRRGETNFPIDTVSSRSNAFPTQAVVLTADMKENALLELSVRGTAGEIPFLQKITVPIAAEREDHLFQVLDQFSSPRIKIHKPLPITDLTLAGEWRDPNPGAQDFYLLKVFQKNGHTGWSSPLFFR